MATFTSIDSYRKGIRKRMRNLRSKSDDVVAQASHFMALKGKQNAPRHKGSLTSSITRSKRKNGQYTVTAGYKGNQGFPVAPWTNRNFAITVNKTNKYFQGGQTFKYGDAAKGPSGKNIRWTARLGGGWWDKTVQATARRFRKTALQSIRTTLRGA